MRELALALLNDEHGVNKVAWKILIDLLVKEKHKDILNAVKVQDERWYLPTSFFE